MVSEKMPVIDAVREYIKFGTRSFHTPGHKSGVGASSLLQNYWGKNLFLYDLTEVAGLDNLHDPKEAIKEAENLAAKTFGADKTFFLVNGTSGGIQAAIMALFNPGEEIILPRNSHRSVYTGLVYSGATPRYIYPSLHEEFQIPLGIKLEQVKKAFDKYSTAKGIFLLNPTYHGVTSELQQIIKYAHSIGKIVIVDEAHGSHFRFDSQLPSCGLEAGADVVVQSTHKTLSSLTQSSLLHLKKYEGPYKKIKKALQLTQTSSPSYVLMSSLDAMRHQMDHEGEELVKKARSLALEAKKSLIGMGLEVLSEEDDKYPFLKIDPTKLLIRVSDIGLTGYRAEEILRKDHQIQVEMSDPLNILAIVTIGDSQESIGRLIFALKNLTSIKETLVFQDSQPEAWNLELEQILTPREAWIKETEMISIKQSVGRVLGEEITPYPPGVPLAVPGEAITKGLISHLQLLQNKGCYFQALHDPKLENIKVII